MSAIGATTAPLRSRAGAAGQPSARPLRAPEVARPRPRLTIVTGTTSAGRMPFAVLVGAILLAGLMSLLLVHTLAAQESFRVHDLTQRLATLQDTEQELAVANQQVSTPAALRTQAEDLGMRPSTIGDYRTMKNGRVIGALTAIPVVVPAPVVTKPAKAGHKAAHKTTTGNATKSKHTSTTSTKTARATKVTKATKASTSPTTTTTKTTGHAHHHAAGRTGASAH
jgi:hypothetical protein